MLRIISYSSKCVHWPTDNSKVNLKSRVFLYKVRCFSLWCTFAPTVRTTWRRFTTVWKNNLYS